MNISTRLILLFFVVAIVPLGAFSYINLQNDEEVLRDEMLNKLSIIADKKALQIRSYLNEQVDDVRLLGRMESTQQALVSIAQIYRQRGVASSQYSKAESVFRNFVQGYLEEGRLYDVFLITPEGEIVYTHKHENDFATNLINGPYRDTQLGKMFRQVRMTLAPTLSAYEFYAPSNNAPAAFIAAPVMAGGRFEGVIAVQFNNQRLLRVVMDATGMGETGETVLTQMDGDGIIFTAPLKSDPDAAMKRRMSLQDAQGIPALLALSGGAGEGVMQDYRGISVIAAWRYLPDLNWGMDVKIDTEEAFVTIRRQRELLLEMLLGLILLTGMVAFYLGRQISEPLKELSRAADGFAQGDLSVRADESVPGEMGRFAFAFNRMAVNLQDVYRNLELRVEERTRELHVSNEQLQEEIIEREHIERALRESQAQAENAVVKLQQNQELLNEAQHMGKLGSWELNLVTGELRWSDEIYRMFELDPAQFQPSYESFLKVIHPEDRDKVNQAYTRSLQDKQPYDVVHRLLFADGRIKWVREHCNSDFDASGKAMRSVGAVQDITEQKLAEDRLRIAAATFETHEGIMITDVHSTILQVNQAFQDITGYSAEDVLGRNPRILNSGKQGKEFYAEMWRSLLDEGEWSGEIWDRRKSGEIYPKWLTITAVKDAGGTTTEYVAIFSDITERKRAEEEIRNLAFYDALTGLPNRRLLMDRFHLALSLSARSHNCGAILFMDMDKFKTLNDTLGHDYGDLLLIEVGRRIQACVRETDTVARLGGDEFVVLIEEVGASMKEASQKVSLVAEKIRFMLSEPYKLKEIEYHSSPSIGVCMYLGNTESVDELMKRADLAMYQAKDSGRNAVRFFDPVMQQTVEARAKIEADLRNALPNEQLRLYYQIQVDSEHRPIGAEALIRWLHPERGMVSPAQFIPVAEESSLILDIGNWVIETACRQLAEWQKDEQMRHLLLAINVSAQQFCMSDFVTRIEECILHHGISSDRLKLELTESVVLENVADVVAKMHALKALGIRLSLDDFGTGYSSLSYLKQLPLDQLKIDQSFVRDITSDPNDAVMVKTIIGMAKNFRLNVIAEGVETEAQLLFLKESECMAYQGYFFSKPIPVAEFEVLARRMYGTRE